MRRALAISILVLLGASACGGSGSSEEGTSQPTESATVTDDDVETPATVTDSSDAAENTTMDEEPDSDAGTLSFADHLSTGDCFDDQFDDQGDYDYSHPPIIVPCDEAPSTKNERQAVGLGVASTWIRGVTHAGIPETGLLVQLLDGQPNQRPARIPGH